MDTETEKKRLNALFLAAVQNRSIADAAALLDQGADIDTRLGSAFLTAVRNNDSSMAAFLVKKGARIVSPCRHHYQELKSSPLLEEITLWAEAEKIAHHKDGARHKDDLFRLIFGSYTTLQDLKEERPGSQGFTGLTLAAKAGLMHEILTFALDKKDDRLEPENFFIKDRLGQSVVDILGATGEIEQNLQNKPASPGGLSVLFIPGFWDDAPQKAEILWQKLPEKFKSQVSIDAWRHAVNIQKIDRMLGKRRQANCGR